MANFATPGLLAGIALAMGAIYGADQFLARLERREIGAESSHVYQRGEELLKQGKPHEAIELFRRAHILDRDNRAYVLGLAHALIADRQPARAEDSLQELLSADSNDAAANLLIARAMVQENRPLQASSYYHRAIYGTWPDEESSKRIEVRLELVKWLSKRSDEAALLAELLPLEEEAKGNRSIERELPALYLQAGTLQRAEDAYRKLIRTEPDNADAYAGLARVELEKGNYHAAEQYFGVASRRRPDDGTLKLEAEMARVALNMDPTPRRLTSFEKLTRSNRILQLTLNTVDRCKSSQPADPLTESAQKALTAKPVRVASNEMAEARLDLAEQIWKARPTNCESSPEEADLLAVLMRKISQQ